MGDGVETVGSEEPEVSVWRLQCPGAGPGEVVLRIAGAPPSDAVFLPTAPARENRAAGNITWEGTALVLTPRPLGLVPSAAETT